MTQRDREQACGNSPDITARKGLEVHELKLPLRSARLRLYISCGGAYADVEWLLALCDSTFIADGPAES